MDENSISPTYPPSKPTGEKSAYIRRQKGMSNPPTPAPINAAWSCELNIRMRRKGSILIKSKTEDIRLRNGKRNLPNFIMKMYRN